MGQRSRSESQSLGATRVIADIARTQHGIASRKQLMKAGLSSRLIEDRVSKQRLTPVLPGIYSPGTGKPGWLGLLLAATMACGQRVVVSHRSAAQLWGIGPAFPYIELVSASMRKGKIRNYLTRGLIVHQTRSLPHDEVTRVNGIPTTTIARTLVDLAAVVSLRELASAFNEADRRGLLNIPELNSVLESSRGRRGLGRIRKLAQARDPQNRRTRSELESEFLALCSRCGIVMPEVNRKVMGLEVDCLWPDLRLIVELDGLAFHSSPQAVETDKNRDARLQVGGYLVLRLTYRNVFNFPGESVRTLKLHMKRAEEINTNRG